MHATSLLLALVAGATILASGLVAGLSRSSAAPPDAIDRAVADASASPVVAARTPQFPVRIHRPDGPPRVATDRLDALGRPVTVACSSCHSLRPADPTIRDAASLDEFHQGLTFAHGDLSCRACHHPDDADQLRLADGQALPYRDVMTLCSQCHGQQRTSYDHGAHGGMNGYWDLSRGERTRNNCIDCHDPHAPAFPSMRPTFKPVDRFLESVHQDTSGAGHE